MRTLCDNCESAAAIIFCAADEAALCRNCDDKVHKCNKLASRHVRVVLDNPVDVPRCDICENSPDGSSLCLQCDTSVHVGGKRTHPRYLLLRQRVKFPGDDDHNKPGLTGDPAKQTLDSTENKSEYSRSTAKQDMKANRATKMDPGLLDLNLKPNRLNGQDLNNKPG